MSDEAYRGASPRQRQMLGFMQKHHPDEWVVAAGENRMPAKGLVTKRLAEGRHRPDGALEIRLTKAGRESGLVW